MFVGSESIDLRLTLIESAQCFRWTEADGCFGTVMNGEAVWLRQESDGLYAEGGNRAVIRDYLDLDRDYGAVAKEYASVPVARRAIELYPGLRVLNQDPWDTLISFILSANNNVIRIQKLNDALAQSFGERYETPRGVLFAMPSPKKLASCGEEALRALGVGYRAPYLIQTAQMVEEGFPLWKLCEMEYAQAHAELLHLAGVGDKVADCVLLFGCRQTSAFPVDVWVEKLLRGWFGIEAKDRKKLLAASQEMFGKHAGLLQQFLFHAARTGGIALPEKEG